MPSQVPLTPAHACLVKPYEHIHIATPAFPPFDNDAATFYRYRSQRSVNLGSWLVIEDWVNPALMGDCAREPRQSELDVALGWNGQAEHLLARHWDEWIKEEDFQWLSSVGESYTIIANPGINTVRLPIG